MKDRCASRIPREIACVAVAAGDLRITTGEEFAAEQPPPTASRRGYSALAPTRSRALSTWVMIESIWLSSENGEST